MLEQRDPREPKWIRANGTKVQNAVAFLRSNPGVWYVWPTSGNAGWLKKRLEQLDPDSHYEVTTRTVQDQVGPDVFLRYVGPRAKEEDR